jgi:hypothetical protein
MFDFPLENCPQTYICFLRMGWIPSLTMLPCGKQFRLHRKILHQHLNRDRCVTYQPIQTREARLLVQNLISEPKGRDEFLGRSRIFVLCHIPVLTIKCCRFATGVIIQVTYGHQITSSDDWYLNVARDASLALFETGIPGGTLIDAFPAREYRFSMFLIYRHL